MSWREVVKVLDRLGYRLVRQKGSHMLFKKDGNLVVVPKHKEIRPGTLLNIIDQIGLTKQEFIKLLRTRLHKK